MGRRVMIAAVIGAAVLLVGCGGGGDSGGGTTAATVPAGGATGNTVAVTLGENSSSDMYMNLSQATASAGKVTFVVTNEGSKVHEFVVIKTDTPAADFPVTAGGIEEEAPGVEVVDEIEEIATGATEELAVDLEAGHYALICNLKGHYEAGMRADLDVT